MYYIIKCSHAETIREADEATIRFASQEYIQMRMEEKKE